MGATETITLRLVAQDLMSGNVSKAIGSLDRLAKRGGLVGSVLQGVGQSMGQLINPVGLVANGIGMVTDALSDSIKAFNEDALSQKKLQTSLEANIEAWDGNTKAIEDLIASRMRLGFSDDAQRESLALIVAQVEDVNDALAIQRTAMDLARLKSMSLADASTLLAKAYLGSATGLQKMGIKLGKGVDGMEAIEAVQKRAAGQAEAYTETMVGAAEVMAVSFDEFKESVGGALTDALTPFFNLIVDITNQSPDLDSAIGRLTDKYREMVEVKADAIKQDDSWDDEVTSLLRGVFMPQDQAITDYVNKHKEMVMALGVSRKEFALFAEAALTAGMSWDQITEQVRKLQGEMGATAVVVSGAWTGAMEDIGEATETTALTMKTAMAGMKRSVRQAINGTLTTMDDMKGPWIEAWKEYARSAKDPFSQKAFENWLEKRAEKAVDKAREAAKEGRPKAARRWRELAAAFRDPVIVALTQINGSVIESMGIISLFKQQTKGLNNILPALGSVFGNDKDGGNGGHWKQTKNGVKWVEGNGFGATPYSLPAGGSGMGSGGAPVINVTHIGSMSEADGQRFARTVAPHINRELGRGGR